MAQTNPLTNSLHQPDFLLTTSNATLMSAVWDKIRVLQSHRLMTRQTVNKNHTLDINPDLDLPPAVSRPDVQDHEPINRV